MKILWYYLILCSIVLTALPLPARAAEQCNCALEFNFGPNCNTQTAPWTEPITYNLLDPNQVHSIADINNQFLTIFGGDVCVRRNPSVIHNWSRGQIGTTDSSHASANNCNYLGYEGGGFSNITYFYRISCSYVPDNTATPDESFSSEEDTDAVTTPSVENFTENISAIKTQLRSLNKLSAPSIPALIGQGLRLFTGVFGSIALIMVIYGGLQIMFARGQSDKIKSGANVILWASIGLITMMLSYVLVGFVMGAIL